MIDIDTIAFLYCIRCQDTYNAMEIINMGRIDYGYIDKHDITLLMWACWYKMQEVAVALITTGEANPWHVSTYTGYNGYNYTASNLANYHNLDNVCKALSI